MTAEVEALLERLDNERPTATDNVNAAALIRAQAEEIVQVTSERDLLGTVVGTGYPPPANLIKDEMTRRRIARAVELHEEIARLREQIAAAAKQEPVAWLGVGFISKKPIVQLPDEPIMPACDPWRPLYAAPVPAGDAVREFQRVPNAMLEQVNARIDELERGIADVVQAAVQILQGYSDSYKLMADCYESVYPSSVRVDFEKNIIPAIRAIAPHAAKGPGAAQAETGQTVLPGEASNVADAPAPASGPAIRVPWRNPAPIPTERTPLDTAIKIAELERECERLRAEQREEYAKTRAAIETWRGRCNELQVVADAAKAFVAWWTDGQDDFDDLHKRAEVIVVAVRALDRGEAKS
jgi:flagellar motility protein MotE (MotC chaperone)